MAQFHLILNCISQENESIVDTSPDEIGFISLVFRSYFPFSLPLETLFINRPHGTQHPVVVIVFVLDQFRNRSFHRPALSLPVFIEYSKVRLW